ncbi:hypothetical protein Pcaca05_05350 [Pectobacterium carotovorum subsp. carotovorum]|nr:hypothetical protein Pcaca05_05350 [Pectobacterium carotovorum subsp. carotovorum]
MLTLKDASYLFSYDHLTGLLKWKNPPSKSRYNPGDVAGTVANGYLKVSVSGKSYYVHRITWLLHYGNNPEFFIDHINGNRSDNRISNLRLASNTENIWNSKKMKNNSSGVKGVCWNAAANKWVARIRINGERKTVGAFSSIEDAELAITNARNELHGDFSRND